MEKDKSDTAAGSLRGLNRSAPRLKEESKSWPQLMRKPPTEAWKPVSRIPDSK